MTQSNEQLRHRASSHHVNGFSHRRNRMSSEVDHSKDILDEEQGQEYSEHLNGLEYEEYELTSSLIAEKHVNDGGNHTSNTLSINNGTENDDDNNDQRQSASLLDADDTKNSSQSDLRSRSLFLQTAFWIGCWYVTSLATLFLNKIILSRPGASVHVLGMCQMTTAAVLGGWTAHGGGDKLRQTGEWAWNAMNEMTCRWTETGSRTTSKHMSLDKSQCRRQTKDNSSSIDSNQHQMQIQIKHQQPSDRPSTNKNNSSSTTTATTTSSNNTTFNYSFLLDMLLVGLLRGATVLLGLIALNHIPLSFVETIKATAPAFTVLFARLILKERTAPPVLLTLVPVVAGLILCSAVELKFDAVGFVAAVSNNCADCVQNVVSKRMLARMKPTQLQFYTSVAALVLQIPFVVNDAAKILIASGSGMDWELSKLLLIDAIFYHLQSVSAYCTMGCMSPVSQSVANTLKRALLVWASILYFGNPVTWNGILGILMVVSGVFFYNHARRVHQS